VDSGLSEHAVILELRLAKRRGVASDDDKLGLAGAKRLEGRLVAKGDCRYVSVCKSQAQKGPMLTFTGLHNKRQARVDAVLRILLLGGHLEASGMSLEVPEDSCALRSWCGRKKL